jgi:nitrogen fixation protein NifU and related proteins
MSASKIFQSHADALAKFQAMVLAHNRCRPHFGELVSASHRAQGANPLCGDEFLAALYVLDDRIIQARFHGEMSAISIALGEMLCSKIESLSLAEGEGLLRSTLAMLAGVVAGTDVSFDPEFQCFQVLSRYPSRLKTATLPAATLLAALLGDVAQVCTEAP